MATPLLGFIRMQDRTPAQHAFTAQAESVMIQRHGLPVPTLAPGQKVMLTDTWKNPAVIAALGMPFTRFHQLTGSCFPGGTPVRLADGSETAIEAIQVGDEVITHKGRTRRVTQTMTRLYNGDLITLNVSGFPFPLEMTADHEVAIASPFGGIRWERADQIEEGDKVLLGWNREEQSQPPLDCAALLGEDCIILDDLMKDRRHPENKGIADPPNANITSARDMVRKSGIDWKGRVRLHHSRVENSIFRHIPICSSLGRLIGIYLAEGGCHEGRAVFTFNADERETLAAEVLALVRGLFGVEGEIVHQAARPNTCKVQFNNQNLAEVFKALMPGNVYTKRVPGFLFNANEETRLALLLGWMAGDGYVGVKGGKKPGNVRITGVTSCAGLARDMTTLALSCGLKATAGRRKARLQSKVSYGVDLCGQKAVRLFAAVAHRAEGPRFSPTDTARTPHGYARKVRSIERHPVEQFRVFDFEVEEDHSFIAKGLTVHNCVGAGGGNALMTLICVQASLGNSVPVLPFWLFDYGRCRYNEGDRGQGEGAMGSSFADTIVKEGVLDANEAGLPKFDTSDGFTLTSKIEMTWSDGASSTVTKWGTAAAQYPLGSVTPVKSSQDIKALVLNGYPGSFACDNYIGNASVQGSGADAALVGYWDGNGGHQQYFMAYWEHLTLGPLYGIGNNWAGNTYVADPGGLPLCTCWVKEAKVDSAIKNLHSEVYGFGNLKWFPAQPQVLIDYAQI